MCLVTLGNAGTWIRQSSSSYTKNDVSELTDNSERTSPLTKGDSDHIVAVNTDPD